ncbi:hypothetical protein G9444_4938 [Rhodococcus erythropolis]|uniref:Uncharacterized protein n=1 Tax=Rhodococcus erythropolis TaxID=1833 RepID=A0A6G9D004_RHOER|nr:hypothetical protein G9444_4938 [Rhodococcus erythropolis]
MSTHSSEASVPLDSPEHAESAPSVPSAAAPARNPRRVKESIRRVNSPSTSLVDCKGVSVAKGDTVGWKVSVDSITGMRRRSSI